MTRMFPNETHFSLFIWMKRKMKNSSNKIQIEIIQMNSKPVGSSYGLLQRTISNILCTNQQRKASKRRNYSAIRLFFRLAFRNYSNDEWWCTQTHTKRNAKRTRENSLKANSFLRTCFWRWPVHQTMWLRFRQFEKERMWQTVAKNAVKCHTEGGRSDRCPLFQPKANGAKSER